MSFSSDFSSQSVGTQASALASQLPHPQWQVRKDNIVLVELL